MNSVTINLSGEQFMIWFFSFLGITIALAFALIKYTFGKMIGQMEKEIEALKLEIRQMSKDQEKNWKLANLYEENLPILKKAIEINTQIELSGLERFLSNYLSELQNRR